MTASSITEQIMAYLAAKLSAATGFTFYRERETPVTRQEGLVGILDEDEEETAYQATALILRTFYARVTIIARASEAAPVASTVADAARVAVFAAIMKDQTLGGLAGVVTDEGTKWLKEEADRNAVSVEMRFRIRYATVINDLTQVA
jgi:hydrogenase maturation factor